MSIRKQAGETYLVEAYVGGSRTRRIFGSFKEAKAKEQEILTVVVASVIAARESELTATGSPTRPTEKAQAQRSGWTLDSSWAAAQAIR